MSLSSMWRYENEPPAEGISVASRGLGAPDLAPSLSSDQVERGQATTVGEGEQRRGGNRGRAAPPVMRVDGRGGGARGGGWEGEV
uniref:Uncharacterized protein n=1 Tax=Oryza rufipogon TaxID=4529 RepID=A0A0E0MRR2_ORYRU